MQVISAEGMKGGVGKSVDAVNLAACLAYKKKRVLFIDGDYQANSSLFFGKKKHAIINRASLYEVLIQEKAIRDVIVPTDFPFLDMVPATNELSLFNEKSRDRYLLRSIIRKERLEDDYDFVIIDSRPELSDLFRNIAVASNSVILPIFVDPDSIDGLSLILRSLRELSESKRDVCGEEIALLGAVVNNYDKRFATQERLLPIIQGALKEKHIAILAEVPRSGGISSSQDSGRPLAFMPRLRSTPAGQAFFKLADEVLRAQNPKKGRPRDIPVFTERERSKLTERLYEAESLEGLSGEMSL